MDSQRNAVEQVKEIVSPSRYYLRNGRWTLLKTFLTRDLLLWIASGYHVVEFHCKTNSAVTLIWASSKILGQALN